MSTGRIARRTGGHLAAVDGQFRDASIAMAAGFATERDATARKLIPGWFGPLGSPALVEWAVGMVQQADPTCGRVVDSLLTWDPRPRLAGCQSPFTFVHGGHDPIPVDISAQEADACAHGTLHTLDWAGHMPHVEAPGAVAGIIEQAAAD